MLRFGCILKFDSFLLFSCIDSVGERERGLFRFRNVYNPIIDNILVLVPRLVFVLSITSYVFIDNKSPFLMAKSSMRYTLSTMLLKEEKSCFLRSYYSSSTRVLTKMSIFSLLGSWRGYLEYNDLQCCKYVANGSPWFCLIAHRFIMVIGFWML